MDRFALYIGINVFNAAGTKAYLGSQTGLMQFDPAAATNSVSVSPATTGKVLAISPKGDRVIVSDTQSSSNKLFILDPSRNTSVLSLITGTNVATLTGTITGRVPRDPPMQYIPVERKEES